MDVSVKVILELSVTVWLELNVTSLSVGSKAKTVTVFGEAAVITTVASLLPPTIVTTSPLLYPVPGLAPAVDAVVTLPLASAVTVNVKLPPPAPLVAKTEVPGV